MAFLKYFLYATLIIQSNPVSFAEETSQNVEDIQLFTNSYQREQINSLREKLIPGEIIEEAPIEVEVVKRPEIKFLPQITFKGMVKRKGHETVIWVEEKNNLQSQKNLGDEISIVDIGNNQIELNYKDTKGIKLKLNQVYVPLEKRIYENYLFDNSKSQPVEAKKEIKKQENEQKPLEKSPVITKAEPTIKATPENENR